MTIIFSLFWTIYFFFDDLLNPKQKWLTKQIPTQWTSNELLLGNTITAIFLNSDREDWVITESNHDDPENEWWNHRFNAFKELLEVHDYITFERPYLHEQLGFAEPEFGSTFERDFKDFNDLTKKIEDKDTWAYTTIIKHRQFLF